MVATRAAMVTQAEKGQAFRALHERDTAFIIPNPWDIGTARLLAHLGFEALATTSAGYAFSVGRPDHTIHREEMMMQLARRSDLLRQRDLPAARSRTCRVIVRSMTSSLRLHAFARRPKQRTHF